MVELIYEVQEYYPNYTPDDIICNHGQTPAHIQFKVVNDCKVEKCLPILVNNTMVYKSCTKNIDQFMMDSLFLPTGKVGLVKHYEGDNCGKLVHAIALPTLYTDKKFPSGIETCTNASMISYAPGFDQPTSLTVYGCQSTKINVYPTGNKEYQPWIGSCLPSIFDPTMSMKVSYREGKSLIFGGDKSVKIVVDSNAQSYSTYTVVSFILTALLL
ncbi:hypothetical protein BC833DRAFT_595301 [Globomyces pollinis-pini]|nr:hypothetical protein BC833DRAFT_595301 [Globomyces pollinis-pini]